MTCLLCNHTAADHAEGRCRAYDDETGPGGWINECDCPSFETDQEGTE